MAVELAWGVVVEGPDAETPLVAAGLVAVFELALVVAASDAAKVLITVVDFLASGEMVVVVQKPVGNALVLYFQNF